VSRSPRRGPAAGRDRPARARGVVLRDEGSFVIVDLDRPRDGEQANGREGTHANEHGGAREEVACTVRKSLRQRAGRGRKAVVVGDRVEVERSGEGAAIAAVEPRRTAISRRDPSNPRREQILVANVDAVLVVVAAARPAPVPGLVDRFLVAIESRGLETGIVVNKVDLDPEGEWRRWGDVYRGLGYAVFPVSALQGEGLEAVRGFLAGQTTSLLGHSGVGKSTLANALDASLQLRTGDVQDASGKGMHTTTTVSLLPLPWGGYLVDTPGIREFALWDVEPADLGIWFREIADRADGCRFNDCLHENEPGCAVRAALDAGAIPPERYDSYRRILDSLREDAPDF